MQRMVTFVKLDIESDGEKSSKEGGSEDSSSFVTESSIDDGELCQLDQIHL